ncbi:MAG TPA: helicase-related protein [Blastocatellia bacterium]|nr:helicase-related protein [Blastocatellia bacterium]
MNSRRRAAAQEQPSLFDFIARSENLNEQELFFDIATPMQHHLTEKELHYVDCRASTGDAGPAPVGPNGGRALAETPTAPLPDVTDERRTTADTEESRGQCNQPLCSVSGTGNASGSSQGDSFSGIHLSTSRGRQRGTLLEEDRTDFIPDPTDGDYHITDLAIHNGGQKTKFRQNIAAIELTRRISAEGRRATPEEQETIARFAGWGQLAPAFGRYGHDWQNEQTELRTLLTDDEYQAAQESTVNAHYTAPSLVKTIWQISERLGFTGGRIIEPSLGIGNFFGLLPEAIRAKSKLTGIELDQLTGEMARLLYPSVHIEIRAFQDVPALNNFYDLAISNVPFGNITITSDRRHRALKPALHDYFFLRSVNEVRPGGLIVFLTSRYTMDKADSRIRASIAEQADLITALRFPAGTFRANAGTDVVVDLIILQKRQESQQANETAWLELAETADPDGAEPIAVNEYFVNHPEQILGRLDRSGKMYQSGEINVSPTEDYEQRLAAALERLPQSIYQTRRESHKIQQTITGTTKEGGFTTSDDKLYIKHNGQLIEYETDHRTQRIIEDALKVRDALRQVFDAQLNGADAETIEKARWQLNYAYDLFVTRHGYLHLPKNSKAFANDPDAPLVLALEHWNPQSKRASKAEVFFTNTIRGYEPPQTAASLGEAVGVSLNESATIDLSRIAGLLGCTTQEAARQLVENELAFNDPARGWTPADLYLSGNVRQKLEQSIQASLSDPQFLANVAALEKAQPEDIPYTEIDARVGAPWIPPSDVQAFMAHLLGGEPEHFEVRYLELNGSWHVGYTSKGEKLHALKPAATQIWGTARASFITILQAALDDKPVMIYDQGPKDTRVLNHEASAAANAKVREVREAFKEWLWEDQERRQRLHRSYNDTFNNTRPIQYNGSHLTFPGLSPEITLRPHQVNAIWQTISQGRALYAHEVGSGKTATMVVSAMELRRLGLAHKPAIACLKANIDQVINEARRLYPQAKIISTADRFEGKQRRQTIAQVATGDWDIVICTHDNLDMLPMRPETQGEFIRQEIRELDLAMDQAGEDGKKGNRIVKRLAKAKLQLEERLKEALEGSRKDNAVYFEETGIDFLFVDEAHRYKSLPVYTKRDRVKGIPTSRSDRATNMLMRTRWLQKHHNSRGVVFATGTPVANTMVELFTIQRYLQYDDLTARGIAAFDAWANTFGETVTKMEYTPTGEYKAVTRFARYTNLPELMQLVRSVMDVQLVESMPEVKRPRKEEEVITLPMSQQQRDYLEILRDRASNLKSHRAQKGEDNMLSISTDARKSALDIRLVMPSVEDHPESKVNAVVAKVMEIHQERPEVTQMIFSDIGIHPTYGYSVYQDIKRKLVAAGLEPDQVIDFSDLTPRQKETAIERLKSGAALVAIGSTEKLGTGINAQDKLYAVHHIDVPWLPASLQQRDGRAHRQGNMHYDLGIAIKIYRYVTTGSFDAFMWQVIDAKTRFIKQIMTGSTTQRTFTDEDTEEISPAKVMALASGNPDLLIKVQLEEDLSELLAAERRHDRAQFRFREEAQELTKAIAQTEQRITQLRKEVESAARTSQQPFTIEINGQHYTERKAAGMEINDLTLDAVTSETVRGSYRGFKLIQRGHDLYLNGSYEISINYEKPEYTIASIDSTIRNLSARLAQAEDNLKSYQINLDKVRAEIGKPFRQAEALQQKRLELDRINAKLQESAKSKVSAAA